jgi:hypothetical protein
MDSFVAIARTGRSWMETSGTCALGDFVPITAEQVTLIKAAVDKKR